MSVFVTKWFDRWARKEKISDKSLCGAIDEMEKGLFDANLGGNLYKKRIAARGRGKSGSYRTLIAFKSGNRLFFVYGFAKNKKDNLDDDEKQTYKALAKYFLDLDQNVIKKAIKTKKLRELRCGNEDEKA